FARSLLDLFKINPKMSVKNMSRGQRSAMGIVVGLASRAPLTMFDEAHLGLDAPSRQLFYEQDRKSTRLNSSHVKISYAVFCLKCIATPTHFTLSLHDALPI